MLLETSYNLDSIQNTEFQTNTITATQPETTFPQKKYAFPTTRYFNQEAVSV
jgi:hypothetical protein